VPIARANLQFSKLLYCLSNKHEVNELGELKGGMKGFFEADMEHMKKFLDSFDYRDKKLEHNPR
jgi:hypothetical protein